MNIKCWWKGHDLYARIIEGKSCYKCKECEIITTASWWDEKSFWDRHENVVTVLQMIGVVVGFVVIIIAVIGIGSLIAYPFMRYSCQQTGLAMQIPWKFDFWAGCLYQIDGRWITDELLNVVELLK